MRIVQTYWRRLDHEATATNAKAVLMDYRHRKHKAKRNEVTIQSPQMDGMPRSPSTENAQENKILRDLEDGEFCHQCDRVISAIESSEGRTILRLLYTVGRPPKVESIMEQLGMQSTAYYHAREDALVAFAELWPPSPSELLVYRTEKRA
ncbi:ArpU family phage packaging/lysis transcriptional regulator [Schleiferilactobacillus perolens]|uniref:ArpU family phage packaging/lysis transcriptional regulator n=1 Tax=Schleiferilactobacillus perolens TaxID=100468 RepID=UPI00070B424D|nr:ArpU family phage packaging/lysis transcriptional regulator [Schleiferilactobacillus perolens]